VEVDELMIVEAYSHVLRIVCQVSGRLRPEVTAMDALRAVLPARTLSGAPKVRAMQIIGELEPHKRAPTAARSGMSASTATWTRRSTFAGGDQGRHGPRSGRR
jgi:anthranilate/para-aminobenzoate synthase component I